MADLFRQDKGCAVDAPYLGILDFLGVEDDGRLAFAPVNEAKHHRSRLVASLTQNPASWVRKTSVLLTRLAGRPMGLLTRLRVVNRGRGYRSKDRIDPGLKDQIRRYYEAENRLLLTRLGSRTINGPNWF